MGRPRGSKTTVGKRVDIKVYESTFQKWNTLRSSLDKSHDDLASFLVEFYTQNEENAARPIIPPLTPIKSSKDKLRQLSSSTPHSNANKSSIHSSSASYIRLPRPVSAPMLKVMRLLFRTRKNCTTVIRTVNGLTALTHPTNLSSDLLQNIYLQVLMKVVT